MDQTIIFDRQDVEKNKVVVVLGTVITILFFLPLVTDGTSAYGRFFANQALLVFLLGIASGIVGVIPFIGGIIRAVVSIFNLVCWILNIVNACKGEGKPLPLIGGITIIK